MNTLEMIGFMIVIFSTAFCTFTVFALAYFGGMQLWRLCLRGEETTERELKDGRSFRDVMRQDA